MTKRLTCTSTGRTLVHEGKNVDESVNALVERLQDLRVQRAEIDSDIKAIERSLEVIGIRPSDDIFTNDHYYATHRPFTVQTLVDACLTVLMDSEGDWLTKSQIEYLVKLGGFPFSTKDSKNSVDVTLRRLAAISGIEVNKSRWGNEYRYVGKKKKDSGSARRRSKQSSIDRVVDEGQTDSVTP